MMYSFRVTDQLIVFLQSFAFGMLICASYDVISFFVGIFTQKNDIRQPVSDIVFSLFLTVSSFCFILSYNLGTFRLYTVLGAAFGIFIYSLAFGQTVTYISAKLLLFIRRLLGMLLLPPTRAIRKIFKKTKKMCKKSLKHIAKKKENVV